MLKKVIIISFILCSFKSFPQAGISLSKTTPSPDAAGLGEYGLVPSNLFNGKAQVAIPLYTVVFKDLSVPISLHYNTGGNKVDEHPGIMGLGWTLQSGGMIYRKVNGEYDEHPKEYPDATYTNEQCYFFNSGRITEGFNDISVWANQVYKENPQYRYDAEPDEFIFNFNGYSGVFYFTRPSISGPVEIKIKPNGNYRLKAEMIEMLDEIEFDDWLPTNSTLFKKRKSDRSFYKFMITDDKGIQYIFGGNPKSIEFSNNGNIVKRFNTIASTWHLSQIISPAGYKIDLNYKKKGRVFTQRFQRNILTTDATYNFGSHSILYYGVINGNYSTTGVLEGKFISVLNPSYLESIVTPAQTISFITNNTNQLDYQFDLTAMQKIVDTESDVENGADLSYWQKLDQIQIPGLRTIKFHYRNQQNKRLRLNDISVESADNVNIYKYQFFYDPLDLPGYNSRMADHWGYYNGRAYNYGDNYMETRDPNPAYVQAEILKKIIYPTGGFLKLEYEPNYYRKIARQFPFVVDNLTSNKIGAGLRVKKMLSGAQESSPPMVKEYFYITNYLNGGSSSSGVLSGEPQYANSGSIRDSFKIGNFWASAWSSFVIYYGKAIDNNFLELSTTNGNDVTYSEVVERSNEGFILHKFTNHDNGYHDKPPYNVYSNFTSKWQEEGFCTMEPFRGLEKNTEFYNENKILVKNIAYDFLIDTSLVYKVLFFNRIYDDSHAEPLRRVSTCAYYLKPPLVRYKEETELNTVNGTSYVTRTDYKYYPDIYPSGSPSYDNYQVAEVSISNSKGENVTRRYKYPADEVLNSGGAVYQEMLASNQIRDVVEETSYNDANPISVLRTTYQKPFSSKAIYKPHNIINKKGNHAEETRYSYLTFDDNGNLLNSKAPDGISECSIWDYKGQFTTAIIKNADLSDVAYTSFESDNKGSWQFGGTPINTGASQTGIYIYNISGSPISRSSLDDGKTYLLTLWHENGSLSVTGGTISSSVLAVKGTWSLRQYTIKNAQVVSISGTGYIDELRLHPVNALMSTCTYNPLIGITSKTNERLITTYYEYNAFQQLVRVRDDDGNLIKTYCYNYVGQQVRCDGSVVQTAYKNELQHATFERDDCISGYAPGPALEYAVPEGKYNSTISLQAANQQAINELGTNGQLYANTNCKCYKVIYAELKYTNLSHVLLDGDSDQTLYQYKGDMVVNFYTDLQKTIPADVSDTELVISVNIDPRADIFPPITNPYTITCTGTSQIVLSNIPFKEEFSQRNFETNQFEVLSVDNYNHSLGLNSRFIIVN